MSESQREQEGVLRSMAEAANVSPESYFLALMRNAGCQDATKADFLVLVHIANKYGLDPLTVPKQIGLMTTKQGIKPYVGFDGWLKMMLSHPDFVCYTQTEVWSGDGPGKGICEAVTTTIYRRSWMKDSLPPFQWTEYLRECRTNSTAWQSHPTRRLKEVSIGQACRFCFGFYIPDSEEWTRMDEMLERRESGAQMVVPQDSTGAIVVAKPAIELPKVPTAAASRPAGASRPADPVAKRPEEWTIVTPGPRDRATAPAFDPAESIKLDQAVAAAERAPETKEMMADIANSDEVGGFDDIEFE